MLWDKTSILLFHLSAITGNTHMQTLKLCRQVLQQPTHYTQNTFRNHLFSHTMQNAVVVVTAIKQETKYIAYTNCFSKICTHSKNHTLI
jgi:hypothetical protein